MYFRYLNFTFFENRHHPSISLVLELYAVTVYSRRAAWMYENLHVMFLVHTGTYQYVLDKNSCACMYRYIPVYTGTYQYVRFCLILSRCTGFGGRAAAGQGGGAAAVPG